jgi:hypothetical protein
MPVGWLGGLRDKQDGDAVANWIDEAAIPPLADQSLILLHDRLLAAGTDQNVEKNFVDSRHDCESMLAGEFDKQAFF